MDTKEQALNLFHPLIKTWFLEKYGEPTDVQLKSWPVVASGKHVLITAPTGSGKTLAAFLWALNQIITGTWSLDGTMVLYISPLKALNNDIQQNLLIPLSELRAAFHAGNIPFPDVSVLTRSGDTPGSDRQRMIRRPPEILITTPESFNLILSSPRSRSLLTRICSVILDEIHAVASDKRGTHLISAVDRLVRITGEFQRIALSATITPLGRIAEFVGGYKITKKGGDYYYEKRAVSVVRSEDKKQFQVEVRFPEDAKETIEEDSWWPALVREFKRIIKTNRSTLIFTNTRRLAEKLTRMINEGETRELAFSHHGSLSREIRTTVEKRLREGVLSAIVATSSLELGVDIGALDEVVLVQTPLSIASGLQRIGRAGHSVGLTSKGVLYPTHGRDFLEAAIMAESIVGKDIEETTPVECPLDVLAQIFVSMTGVETWDIDELYHFVKSSYPFHSLSRNHFRLVLEMLSGRYADTRIRELKPRVIIDRIDGTVSGREGVLLLIYHSGGTIPDRGYYGLRVQGSKAKIGELDEEFVWERSIGDTFNLGAQSWKIAKIDHQDVEVIPWKGPVQMAPFWKAEKGEQGFHFLSKIGDFLEKWNERLDDPALKRELRKRYCMNPPALEELVGFLKRQKAQSGTDLPHRHHVLIEHFHDPFNKLGSKQTILHTLWGGRVNKPLAYALSASWEEAYHYPLESFADDYSIFLVLPHEFDVTVLLSMASPQNLEHMLRKKLEKTGYFGARFRENAGRALLLPRGGFQKRMPLWLNRLRSKKLLESVMRYENFPLLIETWRECLVDRFELERLKILMDELRTGDIQCTEINTSVPTPFSRNLIWQHMEKHMYADDTPITGRTSQLSKTLFQEVIHSPHLRPEIKTGTVRRFQEKIQRNYPGYSPHTPVDLIEWVKERVLIPGKEWQALMEAFERDFETEHGSLLRPVSDKIISIRLPGSLFPSVAAVESLSRLSKALHYSQDSLIACISSIIGGSENETRKKVKRKLSALEKREGSRVNEGLVDRVSLLATILGEWLAYYGPVKKTFLYSVFGLSTGVLDEALELLLEYGSVVIDRLTAETSEPEICDQQNLECLLRMVRLEARPSFEALPVQGLPLFFAEFHGLANRGDSIVDLQRILEKLFGYPSQTALWESDILISRLQSYFPSWLDSLLMQSDLMWFGCGRERASFCFKQDYELFAGPRRKEDESLGKLFPDKRGRFSFWNILDYSGLSSHTLTKTLWDGIWQGKLLNDSWNSVRQGMLNRFRVQEVSNGGRVRRSGFDRWKAARPLEGNWYFLEKNRRAPIPDARGLQDKVPDRRGSEGLGAEDPGIEKVEPEDLNPEDLDPEDLDPEDVDPLEEEELNRDRVRQLFQRYGILFRELLVNELPPLRWSRLFRTMRIMELGGEILSGHFFKGISGPQFISNHAFRILQGGLKEDAIFWINACDPVSLCGIKIDGLPYKFPKRVPTNHLVFHGRNLVMVSRRKGKEIDFLVPADRKEIPEYLGIFKSLLNRDYRPETAIKVYTVNQEAVNISPYGVKLLSFGFRRSYRCYILERTCFT
jgi:ATP-dependent Lhr-like helicase